MPKKNDTKKEAARRPSKDPVDLVIDALEKEHQHLSELKAVLTMALNESTKQLQRSEASLAKKCTEINRLQSMIDAYKVSLSSNNQRQEVSSTRPVTASPTMFKPTNRDSNPGAKTTDQSLTP